MVGSLAFCWNKLQICSLLHNPNEVSHLIHGPLVEGQCFRVPEGVSISAMVQLVGLVPSQPSRGTPGRSLLADHGRLLHLCLRSWAGVRDFRAKDLLERASWPFFNWVGVICVCTVKIGTWPHTVSWYYDSNLSFMSLWNKNIAWIKKLHRQFQHYSSGLFRRFSNQFNDSVTNMYYQHGKQKCVNSKSLLLYHLLEKETTKEQTEAEGSHDNLDDSRRMGQIVGREWKVKSIMLIARFDVELIYL